jgi:hypothetical protein
MKKTVLFTGIAVAAGLAGVAYAASNTLLSPMLPTSVGTSGACYIRNIGTKPISVSASMFGNNGANIGFDNCNGALLGGGQTCAMLSFDLPDDSYVGCGVTTSNPGKVRGTLEIRQIDPILRTLVAEDLR